MDGQTERWATNGGTAADRQTNKEAGRKTTFRQPEGTERWTDPERRTEGEQALYI